MRNWKDLYTSNIYFCWGMHIWTTCNLIFFELETHFIFSSDLLFSQTHEWVHVPGLKKFRWQGNLVRYCDCCHSLLTQHSCGSVSSRKKAEAIYCTSREPLMQPFSPLQQDSCAKRQTVSGKDPQFPTTIATFKWCKWFDPQWQLFIVSMGCGCYSCSWHINFDVVFRWRYHEQLTCTKHISAKNYDNKTAFGRFQFLVSFFQNFPTFADPFT